MCLSTANALLPTRGAVSRVSEITYVLVFFVAPKAILGRAMAPARQEKDIALVHNKLPPFLSG